MNANGNRRTSYLLAAMLAAAAVAIAACSSEQAAPSVGAPPASRHTAAERATTLTWLAKTNQMWTKDDFTSLNQVTTGEARSVYLTEEHQAAGDPSPSGRSPFQLTGLSITVPCHTGSETTFVAYGDTDVFTLGQSMQPVAMVFQRADGAWKLSAVVNSPSGGARSRWPTLCRAGAGTTASAVLAPADYRVALSRALDHAATGATETTAAAAPFAVNSFFSGPDSVNAQSAKDLRQDRAGRVTLTERFTPAVGPAIALPLASGRGYWLVGILAQTSSYGSAAGIRKATWPDGSSVASPRPTVVHHQTDTFVTTYTAIDPLHSAGGPVTLDGFFGWPLTSTAS